MNIETRELSPALWDDFEKLFGEKGACGGCWCMSWRIEKGEDWKEIKGALARRRMKKLVTSGRAHGVLAYSEGEPVGWCSFDRRRDYAKLDRAPSLACDDADRVWSLPCFFVKRGFRGKGVASALLAAALKALKKRGAKIAEAYPAKPYTYGKAIPAAFAWTGTLPMFEHAGFTRADAREGAKIRMRKVL